MAPANVVMTEPALPRLRRVVVYGGACDAGLDCCVNGCKLQGNSCYAGDTNCDPGYFCCNNGHCAPKGGECCEDGSVCGSGIHCVLFDNVQRCCEDLSCGGSGSAVLDYSYPVPSSSIKQLPSFSSSLLTLPSSRRLPHCPLFQVLH